MAMKGVCMNENFLISLDIMWKGMFGIFSVIILITLIVIFIQKAELFLHDFSQKRKMRKENPYNSDSN